MIYVSWLNNLGGFSYWPLVGRKDLNIDISETGETVTNIFPNWGKSYGPTADTIRKQTYRKSRKQFILRTHAMDKTSVTEITEGIKSSVLVQIIISKRDRRTILVDENSVTIYREADKMHSLSFTATFTDDLPSQTV